MTPLVSFIIPVYNVERFLSRCLDSVLAQTYPYWEAICVDDGSPDASADIVAEYAAKDDRVKLIRKENGGLSDARNVGLSHAVGQYVNYIDSDDFIHPQTLEIAVSLAERDRSDIVTWCPDMIYKRELLLREKLGMPWEHVVPRGMKHRYRIDHIRSYCTEDALRHTTNDHWTPMAHPIRHFYAWRHLLKREIAERVPFIKGLKFEDFPWWSEILLDSPRVTITQLPLYYYYYNADSITTGSSLCEWLEHWMCGLKHVYRLYQERATEQQMRYWTRQCLWSVIVGQISKQLSRLRAEEYRAVLVPMLQELWDMGVLDTAYNRRTEYHRRRIQEYIGR